MEYRLDRQGNKISVLGYGCMRFSTKGAAIDIKKTEGEILRAVEGGINYWCYKAEVVGGKYLGEFASDQISRGGKLRLYIGEPFDDENSETYTFDLSDLLKGLEKYIEDVGHFDIDECDAEIADMIIQYTVFGELVYC